MDPTGLGICMPEPAFYLFHGNLQKLENSEIVKKIVRPLDTDVQAVWTLNLNFSLLNGSSKSAFPNFHGNRFEFQNFDIVTLLSDPDRLSVPDFVEIGRKSREEIPNKQ